MSALQEKHRVLLREKKRERIAWFNLDRGHTKVAQMCKMVMAEKKSILAVGTSKGPGAGEREPPAFVNLREGQSGLKVGKGPGHVGLWRTLC